MENVVVLDCGTSAFRAGLALNFPSDDEPRVVRADPLHQMLSLAAPPLRFGCTVLLTYHWH